MMFLHIFMMRTQVIDVHHYVALYNRVKITKQFLGDFKTGFG